MYNHIAIAADGSDNSLRAAQEAATLAKLTGARVTILYVASFETAKTDVLHAASAESLYLQRRQKLAPIEALFADVHVPYELTILNGMPGPTIVDFVHTNDVDLIVIGSRGLNSLQQMVLGSVSHKVMKRVQCPALIVK